MKESAMSEEAEFEALEKRIRESGAYAPDFKALTEIRKVLLERSSIQNKISMTAWLPCLASLAAALLLFFGFFKTHSKVPEKRISQNVLLEEPGIGAFKYFGLKNGSIVLQSGQANDVRELLMQPGQTLHGHQITAVTREYLELENTDHGKVYLYNVSIYGNNGFSKQAK